MSANPLEKKSHVVVVGQGYVGLPVAMAALSAGHRVTGIDTNHWKVGLLLGGVSPIEDVVDHSIMEGLSNGGYHPTADFSASEGFDTAVITVPTPLVDGNPDLQFIRDAATALSTWITPGCLVILESTSYPGTTEELMVPLLERGSGLAAGRDFFVGYSPERIDPGNKTWNLLNTPKVVSGIDSESLARVTDFYSSLGISVVPVSGTREAEMTKLLENTFRHVNIAMINELAMFSNQLGVNIWEAIEAANTKPFGFMRFDPGPGVGGHCLPVDPSYLSWAIRDKANAEFRFVSLANNVNDSMALYVAKRAVALLEESKTGQIEGSNCLLVGLAYKPNTGDTRESPAVAVANSLRSFGINLFGLDEHVHENSWPADTGRVYGNEKKVFDMAIILTNHSGTDLDWVKASSGLVLDTRNSLTGPNVYPL